MIKFNIDTEVKISNIQKCFGHYKGFKSILRDLKIESIQDKKVSLEFESIYPKIYGDLRDKKSIPTIESSAFVISPIKMVFKGGDLIEVYGNIDITNNDTGTSLTKLIKENLVEFSVEFSERVNFYASIKTQTHHHH